MLSRKLLGSRRRSELQGQVTGRRAAVGGLSGVVLVVAVMQPWNGRDPALEQKSEWRPLAEELPDAPIPDQARPLEVESGLFTTGTKRLAESMLESYGKGLAFYDDLAQAAGL